MGGLGFRDLQSMNDALIAKQTWRILSCPDSLMARLLKAKYFQSSDLMSAVPGTHPSPIWKSIYSNCLLLRRWIDSSSTSSPVWLPNADGSFSCKSAYQIIRHSRIQETVTEPSNNFILQRFWNSLWRAPMENTVKTFLWRLYHNAIPTGMNLAYRGCLTNMKCPVCGIVPETTVHLFINCWWSQAILMNLGFAALSVPGTFESVDLWIWECRNRLSSSEFSVFSTALYHIWYNRNLLAHGDKGLEVNQCRLQILQTITWFQSPSLRPKIFVEDGDIQWVAPEAGILKVNCDGAFNELTGLGGLGCVVRDHQGICLGIKSKQILNATSSIVMENMALSMAFEWAIAKQWNRVIFETDCVSTFKGVLDGRMWASDCAWLLITKQGWEMNLIRMEANHYADSIASLAMHGYRRH